MPLMNLDYFDPQNDPGSPHWYPTPPAGDVERVADGRLLGCMAALGRGRAQRLCRLGPKQLPELLVAALAGQQLARKVAVVVGGLRVRGTRAACTRVWDARAEGQPASARGCRPSRPAALPRQTHHTSHSSRHYSTCCNQPAAVNTPAARPAAFLQRRPPAAPPCRPLSHPGNPPRSPACARASAQQLPHTAAGGAAHDGRCGGGTHARAQRTCRSAICFRTSCSMAVGSSVASVPSTRARLAMRTLGLGASSRPGGGGVTIWGLGHPRLGFRRGEA